MRSVCAGCCFPERDEERAFWLVNHILSIQSMMGSTENDSKFSFRKVLKKIGYFFANLVFQAFNLLCFCWCFCLLDVISLRKFTIRHQNKCVFLRNKLFKSKPRCQKCGLSEGDRLQSNDLIKCSTNDCAGLFCVACYIELANTCKYCKMILINDGTISDPEHDSSDDELNQSGYKARSSGLDFSYQTKKGHSKLASIPNDPYSNVIDIQKEQITGIIDCYLKSFYEAIKNENINWALLKDFKTNSSHLDEIDLHHLIRFVADNFLKNIQIKEYFDENNDYPSSDSENEL